MIMVYCNGPVATGVEAVVVVGPAPLPSKDDAPDLENGSGLHEMTGGPDQEIDGTEGVEIVVETVTKVVAIVTKEVDPEVAMTGIDATNLKIVDLKVSYIKLGLIFSFTFREIN